MRKLNNLSFTMQMIINSFFWDILAAAMVFTYAAISTWTDFLVIKEVLKPTIIMVLIMQVITAPLICVIAYNGISERIFNFYHTDSTEKERTLLLESLMTYPFICALITFVYFVIGSILLYFFWGKKDVIPTIRIVSLMECLCGSYFAAICGYSYTMKICTGIADDIVAKGVDHEYVMNRKHFGSSMFLQMMLYLGIPVLISSAVYCAIIFAQYENFFSSETTNLLKDGAQQSRMFFTCTINLAVQLLLTYLFYRAYSENNKRMTACLEKIRNQSLASTELFPTAITDEFEYSMYLSNRMIKMFRQNLDQASTVGNTIKKSTKELVSLCNESSELSIEQSSSTQELYSTMENVTQLSYSIEKRIEEINNLASKTTESVNCGSDILNQNLNKMSEIVEANDSTLEGIQKLNEKINTIWEILKLINGVADQTKIIAFNAELESSRASNDNKNFKNVANEIRRLANNTVNSTKEIREKISEIQMTSEDLIQASQNCSKLIHQGTVLIEGLDSSLKTIQDSAKLNADNSSEMMTKIKIQTESYADIANRMKQISNSVQEYAYSTQTIMETSAALLKNAAELETTSNLFQQKENN